MDKQNVKVDDDVNDDYEDDDDDDDDVSYASSQVSYANAVYVAPSSKRRATRVHSDPDTNYSSKDVSRFLRFIDEHEENEENQALIKKPGRFLKRFGNLIKKKFTREKKAKRASRASIGGRTKSKKSLRSKRSDFKRRRVRNVVEKVGVTEFMKALRLKREEYARRMEILLAGPRHSTVHNEDHPYVALRRKIEAMARTGASYNIEYRPFSLRPKIRDIIKVPVFATTDKKKARKWWARLIRKTYTQYEIDTVSIDEYLQEPNWYLQLLPVWKKMQYWTTRRGKDAYRSLSNAITKQLKILQKCKCKGDNKFWKTHRPTIRWNRRRGAVQSNIKFKSKRHSKIHGFEFIDGHEPEEVHNAHLELLNSMRELYEFLRAKVMWTLLTNKILVKRKLKTMADVIRCVVREREYESIHTELRFLKRLVEVSSVLNLTNGTIQSIQGRHMEEQQTILLDKLIDNVSLYSSDEEEEENDEDDGESHSSIDLEPKRGPLLGDGQGDQFRFSNHSISSYSSTNSINRILYGKPKRTEDELKLDISVRIKRGLNLPYSKNLRELKKYQNERLGKQWDLLKRYDAPPSESFITIKVTRKSETPFLMGVRVIVITNSDHYVLKRLPTPQPLIVHTTLRNLYHNYNGDNLDQKMFHLVMSHMKEPLRRADLSVLLRPTNRISLLDNLDADVYSFVDPVKTCVVIIESDDSLRLRNKRKWKWLTPTLRRKINNVQQEPEHTWDYEETTIIGLLQEEQKREKIQKLIKEPSDVVYHPSGQAYHPSPSLLSLPKRMVPTITTSGSSGSGSSEENLLTENVMGRVFQSITYNDTAMSVPHLTTRDWLRRKAVSHIPVVVIREHETGNREHEHLPRLALDDSELRAPRATRAHSAPILLHELEEHNAMIRPTLIRGTSSVANLLSIEPPSRGTIVDFSNLKNDYPNYWYYSDGRTLVIVKRSNEVLTPPHYSSSGAFNLYRIGRASALTNKAVNKFSKKSKRSIKK